MNKKFLLSVSLYTVLLTAPAFSEHIIIRSKDFKVLIGADLNLQAGARFQPSSKTKQDINNDGSIVKIGPSANNEDVAFMSSAHAYLGAENQTKGGTIYGAHVGIFASTRGSLPTKDHLGRTYGYLQHDNWGRIEFGTKKGASASMQLDGDEVSAGTGGFNGDWDKYLWLTSYQGPTYTNIATNEDNFVSGTGLVTKDSSNSSANGEGMRKITYYTPNYKGFQLGISYAPDEANRGGNRSGEYPFVETGPTRKLKNVFLGGISYEKQIDKKQSFKIVLIGETGTVRRSAKDKTNNRHYVKNPIGYDIGAVYYYDKFGIAGSYGSRGKFPYRKEVNPRRDMFYTAGISYQCTKKLKTSVTYFHSDNRNKLDIISVGTSYDWKSGVQPYAEVTHVIAKQKYNYDPKGYNDGPTTATNPSIGSGNTFKNQGTVGIVGVRISF